MRIFLLFVLGGRAFAESCEDDVALLQHPLPGVNPPFTLQQIATQVKGEHLTPVQAATFFFSATAALLLASLYQQRKYIETADNLEISATEKTKRLAKTNMQLALAMDIDGDRKAFTKENTMLAMRAGCAAVAAGIITFNPALSQWFSNMNYDVTYTCVLVLWCMGRNLGSTVSGLFDANLGTVMAFLWIWILEGILPNGYMVGDSMEKWLFGVAYFVLTTLFMMFGSWKNGVRVWCLSYHVGNMMSWLKPNKPGTDDGYSHYFQIKLDGAALGYVIVTMLASAITVIALSLPNPRMAHRNALKDMKSTSSGYDTLLRCTTKIYTDCAEDISTSLQGAKIFQTRLVDAIEGLEASIDASWWEHFDIGKFADIRFALKKHVIILKGLLNCMSSLHDTLEYSVHNDKHNQLVQEVKAPLEELVENTSCLFETCLASMSDGSIGDDEAVVLQKSVTAVEESITKLSKQMRASSSKIGGQGWLKQQDSFKSDWEFLFLMCSVARLIAELGKHYGERTPRQSVSVVSAARSFSVFSGFSDPAHLDFATRNSVSLFGCFIVGYMGMFSLIPPYTAGLASNASLLMSTAVGSALKKNVGRVQGLVVGTTLGSLLYGFIVSNGCDTPLYYITGVGTIFIFSSFVFYMFLSTTEFSFVFYLLAGFGSSHILQICSPEPTVSDKSTYFEAILIAIVCVTILAVVDIAMSPSAQKESQDAAIRFSKTLSKAITFQLADVKGNSPYSKEVIEGQLNTIRSKASEAEMEPHLSGAPFNKGIYDQLSIRGNSLFIQVLSYRWALRHSATSTLDGVSVEAKKGDSRVFQIIQQCASHGIVRERFDHMLDSMSTTLESVVSAHSAIDGFRANQDSDLGGKATLDAIHTLRNEVGEQVDKFEATNVALDKDLDSSMHVIFTVMEKYVKIIQNFNKDCQIHI